MDVWDSEVNERVFSLFSRLIVVQGPCSRGEFLFCRSLTIGRGNENNVCLPHPTISEKHAVIEGGPTAYRIRDLGSKNGVLLNGKRVSEHPLRHCDRIQIGKALLVFFQSMTTVTTQAVESEEPLVDLIDGMNTLDLVEYKGSIAATTPLSTSTSQATRKTFELLDGWLKIDSVQELCSNALEHAMQLVPETRGVILLRDRDELVATATRCAPRSEERNLQVSRTVVDRVIRSRKGLVSNNVQGEKDLARQQSILQQGISALVAVPIVLDGEPDGVLYLDSHSRTKPFSDSTVADLEPITRALSVAIRELNRRAHSLAETSTAISLSRWFPQKVISEVQTGQSPIPEALEAVSSCVRDRLPTVNRAESNAATGKTR
jgi:two-component system NtrC family sensor kinase